MIRIQGDQWNPPSWGLDRVDQPNVPLDRHYGYPAEAPNVTAYVIDTGINFDHTDFGGRASIGFDVDGGNGRDCNGHGTHVAGTVGGAQYGVAKNVRLKSARVFNCNGAGTTSNMLAGVDWVARNAVLPAVANMSFYSGVRNDPNRTLDDTVRALIRRGVTVAVAAGNSGDDSCQYSPQRVPETINVAASTGSDSRASWSGYGVGTDLFVPGAEIVSASNSDNNGSVVLSGTSMATPHVTGAAAVHLAGHPQASPAQVQDALLATATQGRIGDAGAGTPNRLLRVTG